ncbi:Permease of the drug/metabolite transporter (DMT) superfamily [Desulfovibrio sp. DV]|uniref:DMT family transporter n=1 Tax=Desulfovibrio sp. DV TaxID=1844708 RepID=UPI00094B7975|nr:DMT family transporter [Desulfovibrio sp. DV]OLN31009.1 Permease of the drug/metabolite transporter (DMT) superfamily [Desulfovibrio sp. DV]
MPKRCAPLVFVCLWSTGFIVARSIAPWADPCLFLTARFAVTALVLAALARSFGLPWPGMRLTLGHLAAGGLSNGLYLAAGYQAVAFGLSPGLMALAGALQPPLTAFLAAMFLGESFSFRRAAGMGTALAGVGLAVWPALAASGETPLPPAALALAGGSVLAATLGALAQKTGLAATDLRPAGALQHCGAALVTLVLAVVWGEERFVLSATVVTALAWSVAGLSLGATTLLVWLVRQGEAARAVALLFLVPPLAAVWSWVFFEAGLDALQAVGFALALGGMALARDGTGPSRPVRANRRQDGGMGNRGWETAVRRAGRESGAPGRPGHR